VEETLVIQNFTNLRVVGEETAKLFDLKCWINMEWLKLFCVNKDFLQLITITLFFYFTVNCR